MTLKIFDLHLKNLAFLFDYTSGKRFGRLQNFWCIGFFNQIFQRKWLKPLPIETKKNQTAVYGWTEWAPFSNKKKTKSWRNWRWIDEYKSITKFLSKTHKDKKLHFFLFEEKNIYTNKKKNLFRKSLGFFYHKLFKSAQNLKLQQHYNKITLLLNWLKGIANSIIKDL